MAKASSSIALSFLTLSLALLSFALHSKGDVTLINQMCSKTKIPDDCLACLKGDPASETYDTRALATLAIHCTQVRTIFLLNYLHFLRGRAATDPSLLPLIDDCSSPLINSSDDVFFKILNKIYARNYVDATDEAVHLIGDRIHHCKDIFTQRKEFEESLRLTNVVVKNCNVLIQILTSLQNIKFG